MANGKHESVETESGRKKYFGPIRKVSEIVRVSDIFSFRHFPIFTTVQINNSLVTVAFFVAQLVPSDPAVNPSDKCFQ